MSKIKVFFILSLLFIFSSSFSQNDIKVVTFDQFKSYLKKDDGKIYVINFWATWCKPCVDEMPYFEKLNENYKDKNVHVLLVNLDLVADLNKRVAPFVKKHKIQSEVLLLNDTKYNKWINQVHPKWSGAIPFTLVYKGDSLDYFEGSLTYSKLEELVKSKL